MNDPQAGQPARTLGGGWELIGPSECPLMFRRTLVACRWFKVLFHRFVPNASDEAAHDHPRSFLTVILRGGYDDWQPCPRCNGGGCVPGSADLRCTCALRGNPGWLPVETVRAPTVRFRRAEHAHITHVHEDGATTVVVMGPLRREWGFWKDGKWFEWRTFERLFGLNWRCP